MPFGAVLFDRLVASSRAAGTAVFGINLADAVGYAGSVGVQLFRNLTPHPFMRRGFLVSFSYVVCAVGIVCLLASCAVFLRESRSAPLPAALEAGQAQ